MVFHATLSRSRAPSLLTATICIAILVFSPSFAGESGQKVHRGVHFWFYVYDPEVEELRLHLTKEAGQPNTALKVAETFAVEGKKPVFITNAGIFEGNFRPTGLHVSEGKTLKKLNLETFVKEQEGQFTPNFYLKPNGVFAIDKKGRSLILESRRFAKSGFQPYLATQSGPLLVANGKIHPVLTHDSTSARFRNGVGVQQDGTVVFACSVLEPDKGLSNLYTFAEFFRDGLDCPDALYLDGTISYVFIEGKTPPLEQTNLFAGIFSITSKAKP